MSRALTADLGRRVAGATLLIAALAVLVPATAGAALPDGRGWEMVSPIEKNGGAVTGAGTVAGGGVLQASADGDAVTYSSSASFGEGPASAPAGSQYLSTHSGQGWVTENLTVPMVSGSYGSSPDGVPYQLFSTDLSRGLLLNGLHCRAQEGACPVANPPLAGTDAPAGYQNYYLREGGGFEALVGDADVAGLGYGPAHFDLALAGASPDLVHVVTSSCAALAGGATEAPLGEGCDPTKPNLYEWSATTGLSLVNAVPGAALAGRSTAVSNDGGRVYWRNLNDSNLFLRQGASSKQVDAAAGGGGAFQMATPDGGAAFFLKAEHLWRYDASANTAGDITPLGGVLGMLGAADDGSSAYYATGAGIFRWHEGSTVEVAEAPGAADPGDYPPATGTSRVSSDGGELVFVSRAQLTNYNNQNNKDESISEAEVYLYEAGPEELRCVSCRPNGLRPGASSSIPGAFANGRGAGATDVYKPRVLSADGSHVFFDSSDPLVSADTNRESDVYQWEAPGQGGCAKTAGCVALISSGRSAEGATFVDASLDGSDVFFVTDGSLVPTDPGSFDLYDARVGGGIEEELEEIPCFGDACQSLPSEPVDPGLSTLVPGPGNPRITYVKHHRKERNHCRHKKHGKCSKKKGKGGKAAKRAGGGK